MSSDQGSIMAVFNAVAACGEVSRLRLSELTGFSQVTVGKAVEALASRGILTEKKQSSGTVGRRSGICRVANSGGMLFIDFTEASPRVRVCDLPLVVHGEAVVDASDIGEVCMNAFGLFAELIGGELLGIGCAVPDGKGAEYQKAIADAFGDINKLVLESRYAFAAAVNGCFNTCGLAFFIRASEGGVSCSLMQNGSFYRGANGRAGDIGRTVTDRKMLPEYAVQLSVSVDPELIYIACDNEAVCEEIESGIAEAFAKYGLDADLGAQISVEAIASCPDILEGTARLTREKYILSKLANNS